jgi:hypothetical protein
MKHIKIAFALLAVVFVSLTSFKSNTSASNGVEPIEMWFDFSGDELTDARVPSNYQPAVGEEEACDGTQDVTCQVFVLSNSAQTLPDLAELDALIDDAEVSFGIHNAGEYDNGIVRVIPE